MNPIQYSGLKTSVQIASTSSHGPLTATINLWHFIYKNNMVSLPCKKQSKLNPPIRSDGRKTNNCPPQKIQEIEIIPPISYAISRGNKAISLPFLTASRFCFSSSPLPSPTERQIGYRPFSCGQLDMALLRSYVRPWFFSGNAVFSK